ncbi:uncharacterized protein LOC134530378 [Bacillus rossius redtenbacheri]|uniref:uncharacterized protein LOC134530378 n=1 Tax=Bacillus rossius redtenbacheri TaxID=93214 RepID=UPI002FDD15B8
MDFLARLLHKRPAEPPQSGGGSPVTPVTGPVPTATATAIVAPFSISSRETHEANVEFTRDLVVQLVENLPTKSVKVEPPVVQIIGEPHIKGSHSPCKSLSISENSFTSVNSSNAPQRSDLHGEDTDKKQTDTDTDTAEYESAGDSTVPPSPLGSLAGDYCSQDKPATGGDVAPVAEKGSPCAQLKQTAVKVDEGRPNSAHDLPQVQNDLNISGLCSALEGFHLQSPISGTANSTSDSICDTSQSFSEFQSTPVSKEKLPVPSKTSNLAVHVEGGQENSDQPVPRVSVFEEPTSNVCSLVSSLSENLPCEQGNSTPPIGKCDAETKVTVVETEFFSEVPNKTSTPTDDCVSTTEKETDYEKDSINTVLEPLIVSSGEKVCTEFGKTEHTADISSVVEPECVNGERHEQFSVNSVSHSAVAKSLQETFELLPEVPSCDEAEVPAEPVNQTFEILLDGEPKVQSQVQSLNTTFDLLPTEVSAEPLNTTFELAPSVPLDSKLQETPQLLNKTFECQPDEPAVCKSEVETLNTTFELSTCLLPENRPQETFEPFVNDIAVCKAESVAEPLNKTFELLPDLQSCNSQVSSQALKEINGDSTDRKEFAPQLLNQTFELEDESIERSKFAHPETNNSICVLNRIDLNGNAQLESIQVFEGEVIGGKLVSTPPAKFVSLSDVGSKSRKNVVNSLKLSDDCLQQVPYGSKLENLDLCEQSHWPSSSVTRCDEHSLLAHCESRDASKLIELYKICDEQQKALEQEDEEFVNAEAFFANERDILKSSEASLCSSVSEAELPKVKPNTADDNKEVGFEQISVEAKRLSQQFARSASEVIPSAYAGDTLNVVDLAEMENSSRVECTNKSAVGCSPASNRQSPRSMHGSRGSSPAKRPVGGDGTPKNKHKTVSNNPNDQDYSDVEDPFKPRSRIHNSPQRNQSIGEVSVLSQEVCKKEIEGSSLQNSTNNCHNLSEAGPEIAEVSGSEVFKDPSAFDFLSSLGSQQHSDRNARLESLYVKFDPLVGSAATTNSEVVLPAGVVNGSRTAEEYSSRLGDSTGNLLDLEGGDTPAPGEESPLQTPGRLAAGDDTSTGIRVTPSPASLLIDKLISLSPSPAKVSPRPSPPRQQAPSPRRAVDASPAQQSPAGRKAHPSPAAKPGLSQMEQEAMLQELFRLKELLNEQDKAHAVEAARKDREMAGLQSRLTEAEEKCNKANRQVAEKVKTAKDMSVILDEYEKTISRLIADKEQEQRAHELQVSAIAKERDVHKGHLDTIEIAFSDLHKKYERSKEIIEGLRKNEEVLRASLAEYENSIRSKVQQYEALKKHAVSQLEDANQELDAVRRAHAAESAKLHAMLKKAELKVSSLEEMLEQKIKENHELTHICDELINKVGAGN